MPWYFFHLEGGPKGELISDNRGQVLPTMVLLGAKPKQ
jgi:hypothetical protein